MKIIYKSNLRGIDWEVLKENLITDNFHNGRTSDQLRLSFENSALSVMAFDGKKCIGTGRILSDGVGNAYLLDIWTHHGYQLQGIGSTIVKKLIDSVPGQHVYLQTDHADAFYKKLGFVEQPIGMSRIVGEYLNNDTRGIV